MMMAEIMTAKMTIAKKMTITQSKESFNGRTG